MCAPKSIKIGWFVTDIFKKIKGGRFYCDTVYILLSDYQRKQIIMTSHSTTFMNPDHSICQCIQIQVHYEYESKKGKGNPYSTVERRVPELIPVLGSQPAGDVSHKPGGRLPLLSARNAVTAATLKRAATNFAAWWTEARWVWTVCLRLLPDSDLNQGPSAPESSTLTTRLPSHHNLNHDSVKSNTAGLRVGVCWVAEW